MPAPFPDPAPSSSAHATREGGRVSGAVPERSLHAGRIGIVLDGTLRDAVPAEPDGRGMATFSFPLAGLAMPGAVELEELATGRRLLSEPLLTPDGFVLEELRFDGVFLFGSFSLNWAPCPVLPVLFLSDGAVAARGMADHVPGGAGPATFRFRVPVAVLPAGPLAVVPFVAGVARPEAAHSLSCPFAGYLDAVDGAEISGWVADTLEPGRPVPVEVRRGGRVVAATLTDRPRPDVARAIPGAELCGFRVTVPFSERMRGGTELFRVVVGGTETALREGSVRIEGVPGRLNRVDSAVGGVVAGWALDGGVDGPVPIEVRRDGQVLGRGMADRFRADLAAEGLGVPGLPPGHCAFAVTLSVPDAVLADGPVEVLAAGHPVDGSPVVVEPNPNIGRFLRRRDAVRPAVLPRLRTALDRAVGRRAVSLVLPASGVEPDAVAATLASVTEQWCSRWELLCVHDGFAEPALARVVAQSARREPRIRMVPAAASDGPEAALAAGLAAVRSGYVSVLQPGSRLEPDAVYQLLRAVRDTNADALFTDACALEPGTGRVLGIHAQTAFSIDRFRSAPFWPDLLCVRTSLAQGLPAAEGIGFATAVVAAAERIAHVPAVAVSRNRLDPSAPGAVAPDSVAPGDPFTGRLLVLVGADAAPDWLHDLPARTKVSMLGGNARPSAVNAAVKKDGKGCTALLLVGAGVDAPAPDVLPRLLSLVARQDVAAAGPVLTGRDGTVMAAGVVAAADGVVPALAGPEPQAALRNVSALPGSFLLVRADAWATVGGFDPEFGGGLLCDADLCLRLAAVTGGSVLLDGGTAVSAAVLPVPDPADRLLFAARHGAMLRDGDPWYNPFLAADGSWRLRSDAGCQTVHAPRLVTRRA